MSDPLVPRIYVASLSDYNNGRLHGAWIDATQESAAVWAEVRRMLRGSLEAGAEEWAIHDFEGFGPLSLGEYDNLDHVAAIGRGIAEHGVAFAYWADHLGRADWAEDLDKFEDCFMGHYETLEDWAADFVDASGIDPDQRSDEPLGAYWHFDLTGLARDLESDFAVYRDASGVYLFEP